MIIIVALSLVVVGLGILAWVFLFPSDGDNNGNGDDNGNRDADPVIPSPDKRVAFLGNLGKMMATFREENNGRYPHALQELIRDADDQKAFRKRIREVLYRPPSRQDRTEPKTIIACDARYFDKQRCVLRADGSVQALSQERFDEALTMEGNALMARRIEVVAAVRATGARHSAARGLAGPIKAMCVARLKGIGTAGAMYRVQRRDRAAPDLMILLEERYLVPKSLFCQGSSDPDGGYFYWPTSRLLTGTMVACDKTGNHRTGRNVLFDDGRVQSLSYEDFADALAQPENADFAAAWRAFEGR